MRAFSARGLNNQPLCLVPGVVEENQRQGLTEEEETKVSPFSDGLEDMLKKEPERRHTISPDANALLVSN